MDLYLLDKAKEGDMEARNRFIEQNKSFIHRYSCLICKRYLRWENDDELSIALLAFDNSIDTFKEGNFESYSKLVMKNRLIDFFRKNSRNEVPIEDNIIENYTQYTMDIDEKLDRASQIIIFKDLLSNFKISMNDLTKKSPKHQDTRDKLMSLAMDISKNNDLVSTILKQKMLPIKEILVTFDVSRKTLEEWRRYLIALVIIFSDKRLESLKDFIL